MTNKLESLRRWSVLVADTGDMEAIQVFKPTDSTTNPSLILKAAQLPAYKHLLDEAVSWGKKKSAPVGAVTDRLAVNFGAELTKLVPGRVSTEVDADLSFNTEATIAKALSIIEGYAERGIERDRILIKVASTWEGAQAAKALQSRGIDCNCTLIFSLAQAIACADAKAFLISPFVGRIFDWHVKDGGGPYTGETDPGVISVKQIYAYYKTHDIKTVVMGASFRNIGEIEAIAGCDRLTISPQLLGELAKIEGEVPRQLDASALSDKPERINLDEKSFRWRLNEDQMATEKLSDGIRLFNKDLVSLRKLIEKLL